MGSIAEGGIFAPMQMRAILYMLLSGVAFTGMYLLAKHFDQYSGFQLTLFRAVGTFVPTLLWLLYKGIPLKGKRPDLLFYRGLTGSISLLVFFIALEAVPLTAGVTIRYLSPLIAIVLVGVFLRERVRPWQWFFFALALLGVLFIRGFDIRMAGLGLWLILLSACFDGITFTLVRRLSAEHPMVVVNYFTGMATLLAGLGIIFLEDQWIPVQADHWPLLLATGLVGLVGQLFMTIAMQTGPASVVMPVKYVEPIFLLLSSFFFFGERYNAMALLGIALIILSNALNILSGKPKKEAVPEPV